MLPPQTLPRHYRVTRRQEIPFPPFMPVYPEGAHTGKVCALLSFLLMTCFFSTPAQVHVQPPLLRFKVCDVRLLSIPIPSPTDTRMWTHPGSYAAPKRYVRMLSFLPLLPPLTHGHKCTAFTNPRPT
jgi:hypothetical protein